MTTLWSQASCDTSKHMLLWPKYSCVYLDDFCRELEHALLLTGLWQCFANNEVAASSTFKSDFTQQPPYLIHHVTFDRELSIGALTRHYRNAISLTTVSWELAFHRGGRKLTSYTEIKLEKILMRQWISALRLLFDYPGNDKMNNICDTSEQFFILEHHNSWCILKILWQEKKGTCQNRSWLEAWNRTIMSINFLYKKTQNRIF